MSHPSRIPDRLRLPLYAWHLHEYLQHHPSQHWRQAIRAAPPGITDPIDPHAAYHALYRSIWAHAAAPNHQAFWTQQFQIALHEAWPTDPPSWKRWLWTNPDGFPLLWQAAFAAWRIPDAPMVHGWWNAQHRRLHDTLQGALMTHLASEWHRMQSQMPRKPSDSETLTVMQQTIDDLTQERDAAYENFVTLVRSTATAPPALPKMTSEADPDAHLLAGFRFDVIGTYLRRAAYQRVIESMHGTLGNFWEGMDDQVPKRLSASAVIIDATHIHHSTIQRIVHPKIQIFLDDPSPQVLQTRLIQWATQQRAQEDVPS